MPEGASAPDRGNRLRKPDRLRLQADFDYLRRSGEKLIGKALVLVKAPARSGIVRVGVVCGKKFSPLAVRRNRARRLLWESYRHLKSRVLPAEMVLIPRYRIAEMKEPEVRREMRRLLVEAELFIPDEPTGGDSATGRDV